MLHLESWYVMEGKLKFTKDQLTKPGSQGNVFKTKKDFLQMAQTYFNERWDQNVGECEEKIQRKLISPPTLLKAEHDKAKQTSIVWLFFSLFGNNFGFLFGCLRWFFGRTDFCRGSTNRVQRNRCRLGSEEIDDVTIGQVMSMDWKGLPITSFHDSYKGTHTHTYTHTHTHIHTYTHTHTHTHIHTHTYTHTHTHTHIHTHTFIHTHTHWSFS